MSSYYQDSRRYMFELPPNGDALWVGIPVDFVRTSEVDAKAAAALSALQDLWVTLGADAAGFRVRFNENQTTTIDEVVSDLTPPPV